MTENPSRRDVLRFGVIGGTIALTGAMSAPAFAACPAQDPDKTADRIARSIQRPRIPRRDFLITDHGDSINAAISAAAGKGGGRVVVPPISTGTGPRKQTA